MSRVCARERVVRLSHLINTYDVKEKIKTELRWGNACYFTLGFKLLGFLLLFIKLKIRMYKTTILSIVLYGFQNWSLTCQDERDIIILVHENIIYNISRFVANLANYIKRHRGFGHFKINHWHQPIESQHVYSRTRQWLWRIARESEIIIPVVVSANAEGKYLSGNQESYTKLWLYLKLS